MYELTVTELLARLIRPGDTVVDAGANVGYMTVVAAYAAGGSGNVISFEPHPALFGVLQRNAAPLDGGAARARIALHNVALGATVGTATLALPAEFSENDGIAHIAREGEQPPHSVQVRIETLDSILATSAVRVLKLDVEGFELPVLHGACEALRARRIQHVLFEEHDGPESQVVRLLGSLGYTLFAVGWTISGLRLAPITDGRIAATYEPQNYLATYDPDDVLKRVAPRGWRTLKAGFAGGARQ